MGDLHLEADMLEEDDLLPPRQVPSNKYSLRIAVAIAGIAVLVLVAMVASRSPDGGSVHVTRDTDIEQKMLAPAYHSQECNAHKQCPDDKYCHRFRCVSCSKENVDCTHNGQCCHGSMCKYGKCTTGASKGDPGTTCRLHQDCTGESCCVRKPSINPHISICKPALDEEEICGPENFFKNVYIGGKPQPVCGPCKAGLTCKKVGVHKLHEICTKEA